MQVSARIHVYAVDNNSHSHNRAATYKQVPRNMETNPAYGRTERLDSELMNGNQSEEYVYISNEERRKYVHSSPPSHENNSTEVKDSIEKPTKKSQGNSQTRKCPLIAITVTLVITMLIAITAFAIGIVALYALGEETIDRERQLTVHMEWEQRYNELLNVDSSLQSEVNTLATQINNPMIVRLSQNCTVDTQTCNIEPMSSPLYWRGCLTSPHLINIPVSYQ